MVLRTCNEHEEINDTFLSLELFCRIDRSTSLVSTRPNEKNRIASFELVANDSDLVHGLLEVDDALVGPLRIEKVVDNDLVSLVLVPKLRNLYWEKFSLKFIKPQVHGISLST